MKQIYIILWIINILSNSISCQYQMSNTSFYNDTDYETYMTTGDYFKVTDRVESSFDLIKLRQSLLWNYDKSSRPIRDTSKPMRVKLSISIVQINGLNEAYQIMLSTSQVSIKWQDEFLRWNNTIYSKSISFHSDEMWVPDILVGNNVNNLRFDTSRDGKDAYLRANTAFDMNERNKYPVLVRPDGNCVWLFPIKVMSSCQLDQEKFPFDEQFCYLDFRSSGYEASLLEIEILEEDNLFSDQYESEFDVENATGRLFFENLSQNEDSNFNASIYRVNVQIRRKMVFYLSKIILPYFTFYVVTIFTYCLPVESGEKKSYSTSILISGMIYLKDTSYFVPKTKELPILSVYFNLNLIFIFLIVISSTLVYSIYYLDKTKRPLPNFLRKMLIYSKLMHGINFDCIAESYDLEEQIKQRLKYQESKQKFNLNLIKYELNTINEELINIEKYLIEQQFLKDKMSCSSSIKKEMKNSNDLENSAFASTSSSNYDILGHDVLNLIRTIKLVINTTNDKSKKIVDVSTKPTHKFYFCIGLNKAEKEEKEDLKKHNQCVNKCSSDKPNFKLINTLEGLKQMLTRTNKLSKEGTQKSASRISHASCKHNTEILQQSETYLNLLKDYKSQMKQFFNENPLAAQTSQLLTDNLFRVKSVPAYVYEWKYLAIILDRIFFFIFALIIPICLLFIYSKTVIY